MGSHSPNGVAYSLWGRTVPMGSHIPMGSHVPYGVAHPNGVARSLRGAASRGAAPQRSVVSHNAERPQLSEPPLILALPQFVAERRAADLRREVPKDGAHLRVEHHLQGAPPPAAVRSMATAGAVCALWALPALYVPYGYCRPYMCPMGTAGTVCALWALPALYVPYGHCRPYMCPMGTAGPIT